MSGSQPHPYLRRDALRIALIYTLVVICWVALSDSLIALLVRDATLHALLHASQGLIFVIITGALLYSLITRYLERLERIEQRYRLLFESSHDALVVLDQAGRVVDANAAAARISGYSYDELLQHTMAELTPPDERGALEQRQQGCGQQIPGAAPGEGRLLRKDGQIVPIEISLGPQLLLGERLYLAVIRDMTERQMAAAALYRSEARFRTLFESAPLGVTIASGGRNLYVNPTYVQLFGYDDSGEIIGRPLIEQVAPQERDMIAERNRRREAGLPVPTSYEMIGLRKDGSQFPCQIHVARIDLLAGPASVAFITDITRRKQAEARIQQQRVRASTLAELSRALVEQNLDHHAMLTTLVRRTSEATGDGCVIQLLADDGRTLETAASYHRDPETHALLHHLLSSMLRLDQQSLDADVLNSGQPQQLPLIEPERLRAVAMPEHCRQIERGGAHGGLMVPLRARGRVLGALLMIRPEHRLPFSADEQRFMQELADRAALAVDNARLYYASQQEIIERRHIEQALRTSEANLRAIFDGAHQSITLIGPDYRLIDFNQYAAAGARAVFGKEMAAGQSILEYVLPQDREDFLGRFARTLGGQPCMIEKPIPGLRGIDWWEFYFNPIMLPSGDVKGIIFAARNINERKQAEAALRQTEERLRTVVTHAPLVLIALDRQGAIMLAEGRALDSLGLKPDDLVGRAALELYPAPTIATSLERTLAGEDCTSIDHLGQFTFETRWTPLRDQTAAIVGAIAVSTDVTEREQAVARLRETEAREQAILHGATDAIYLKDRSGRYLVINPAGAQMVGRPIDEVIGRRDVELFPAEVAAEFQASDQQVLTSGQQIETHEQLTIHDQPHFLLTLKAPYRDADDVIQGVIGISRDITELRRTIEALRQSEATNRALLDAIPDFMFRVTDDGVLLDYHAPKGSETLLPDTLIGQRIEQVVPARFAEQIHGCITSAQETGEIQTSDIQVTIAGKLYEFEGRFVNSGAHEVVVIVRDVTERKRLERALRDARDVYLTLVEEVPMLVWRLDLSGRIDFVNKRWLAFTGYTVEQLPATPSDVLIHPLDQGSTTEITVAAWRERRPFEIEYRLRRNDGVYRWVEARGTPFYDEDGHFAGYIGICSDISDRKRQEQIKDDFLALASHELKTPLAALMGYLHLLDRWAAQDALSDRIGQAVGAMVEEGARLNRLINDLLDVSRIQTDKLRMFLQPTDLTELLRKTVANLRVMLPSHPWILEIAAGPPLIVNVDPQRIEQVLTNLCTNAAKYSAEQAPVNIALRRAEQQVLIKVQDCGLGIPAADLPYIFDRFYQVQRPLRESRPGLGLGLYITREIIRQHGGTVSVESVEYGGSVFTILLPLEQTQVARD